MKRFWLTNLVLLALTTPALAGSGTLMRHVRKLVEPQMEGRLVGSDGAERSAEYIADQMKRLKLTPAGDDGFSIETETITEVECDSTLRMGTHVAAPGHEYVVTGFSDDVDVTGPPVYVGFGLADTGRGWNDYANLDVRGRVVVALTGGPHADAVTLSSPHLTSAHSKAAVALAKGASALILVNDPNHHGEGADQRPDVTPRVVPGGILEGLAVVQMTFRAFQKGNPSLTPDVSTWQRGEMSTEWTLDVSVDRTDHDVPSIAGMLKGTTDAPPIVLGAHYDGLGGKHYQGADDNASGVAVLLAVARRMAKHKGRLKRTVVFVALSGEEIGLVGSRRASRYLKGTLGAGVYINMDMVGRLDDRGLRVFGMSEFSAAKRLETAADGSNLQLDARPFTESTSDHLSFHQAGFEAIGLSTGIHPGYHSDDDRIERLDWKNMSKIEVFVARLLKSLAN